MLRWAAVGCVAVFLVGLSALDSQRTGSRSAQIRRGGLFTKSAIGNSRPEPDDASEAMRWRRLAWLDENGKVDPGALDRAARQRRDNLTNWQVRSGFEPADLSRSSWTNRGPQNVSGRTRALVIHPTDSNTIWAGSVSGGVWKTTNGGLTWTPLDDFMANLSANCLAIDPSNPNVLYCGTGEGFFVPGGLQGDGIFKTTDGGTTWSQLASTATWGTDGSGRTFVNRIAVAPANSNLLLAATVNGGIQRSTDGGGTWTTTRAALGCFEVAFDLADGSKAIASVVDDETQHYQTALFSTDGGATWQQSNLNHVQAGGADGSSSRIELSYAPSNPNIVYASFFSNLGISCASPPCTSIGSIWRSTDGGVTYTRTGSTVTTGVFTYKNALWVSPTDPNFIVVGGTVHFKSTDGGQTLTQISSGYILTADPHPDQHLIVSDPGFNGTTNKRVYVCNDGGIFRTDDITTAGIGSGWVSLGATYQTTQYYGAAGNATTGLLIGGTQDNGTLRSALGSQNATLMTGGDGGFCAIDPTDDTYCYGEGPNLALFRSQDHGQSASDITSGLSDSRHTAEFVAPFILDPNNSNTMLAGGANLWRSTNVRSAPTPTWQQILSSSTGQPITAIAVATGNSNIIWVGDQDGAVYKTTNGLSAAPTWTTVDDNMSHNPLPNRFITRILIDPANSNVIYITLGGFTDGNLQKTTDGGVTWTDTTGAGATGLPFVPIRGIARHPFNTNELYVGTEVGVFSSLDGGATWSAASDGPANVSVDELVFLPNSTTLLAATYGRGLWTADVGPNYAGFVDHVGCDTIAGWAADRALLNASINVEIYDGTSLISTVAASNSRPDVGAFLGDNGLHGFSIPTPASVKDGASHTVHVKFETSATDLSNSPVTINCSTGPPNYVGWLDHAGCDTINGWAADRNRLSMPINVEIYDGTTLIAIVPATNFRSDVGAFLGDNGVHGFAITTPASLQDGGIHALHVKFEASATEISQSPASITCTAVSTNYVGYVDHVACDNISGWAADRNRLNAPITVSIYANGVLIATLQANALRPDVGTFLGDNGIHGFTFAIPGSMKGGATSAVLVRFEASTASLINNSLTSLTCP